MIVHYSRVLIAGTVLTLGVAASAIALQGVSKQSAVAAPNAGNFSDTQNYWGQPFIQTLAQKDILNGYPDGQFRPDRPVSRDEFAAIVKQAFNQNPERRISSGDVYKDVPQGYWASNAIKEAYDAGFMTGYPGGYFRPKQSVTRVEALVSLVNNLDLRKATKAAAQSTTTANKSVNAAVASVGNAQPTGQRAKRQIFLPLAGLALMQPLIAPVAQAVQPNAAAVQTQSTNQPAANQNSTATLPPASVTVSNYYRDANQIPKYAVDKVAAATRAGMVVNHPDLRLLRPNQPATRGEVAAFIHQALVGQGFLEPISNNSAANYIVNPVNNTQAKR